MKIVHLSRLYSPHLGGVETHLRELNKYLLNSGHEVTVITEQFSSDILLNEKISKVNVVRIPFYSSYISKLKGKIIIWKFIYSKIDVFRKADVIHIHDVFWWILPIYPIIKNKVYITFHGWETKYPIQWKAKLQRFIYSHLAKSTIHIGGWIQKYYWDKPNLVLYGGVSKNFILDNSLLNKKSELETIVFLGRLSKENMIDKYIDLFLEMKKNNDKLKIIWVGDGDLNKKCQSVGMVTGFIDDIQSYVKKADLVFASSYLSILESQAFGKIVVSLYDHPLKRDYLLSFPGVNQMIVGDSIIDAHEKIKKIFIKTEKLLNIKKQAIEIAKNNTWDKICKKYLLFWS